MAETDAIWPRRRNFSLDAGRGANMAETDAVWPRCRTPAWTAAERSAWRAMLHAVNVRPGP